MHGPHPPGFPHVFDPARCLWDTQHAQQQMAVQGMLAARAPTSWPSAPAGGGVSEHAPGPIPRAASWLCIDCRRTMETVYALREYRLEVKRRHAALSRVDPLMSRSHRAALGATLDDFEASLIRSRQHRVDVLEPLDAEIAAIEQNARRSGSANRHPRLSIRDRRGSAT